MFDTYTLERYVLFSMIIYLIKQILILCAYVFNIVFPEYAQYYLCGWMIYSLIRDTDKDGKFNPSDDTTIILLFAGILGCIICLIRRFVL